MMKVGEIGMSEFKSISSLWEGVGGEADGLAILVNSRICTKNIIRRIKL